MYAQVKQRVNQMVDKTNIIVDGIDYTVETRFLPLRNRISLKDKDDGIVAIAYLWKDLECGEVMYADEDSDGENFEKVSLPMDLVRGADPKTIGTWMAATHPVNW